VGNGMLTTTSNPYKFSNPLKFSRDPSKSI
jgi:hypothetical protein